MHHNELKIFIEKKLNVHPTYQYSLGGMSVDKEFIKESIYTHHWVHRSLLSFFSRTPNFLCECGANCFVIISEHSNEYFSTPIITLDFECDDFRCTLNWDIKDIIE